ncbi:fibroblast growth factor receptor substrate 3 [Elysia marginata]|uniref:Fibroblast growth factor receptor substrate 3 n=1 Tax=Elysia marginata TaxID=1093978 RepID=A0AAV4IE71_9GAST|nr:fibroblast growth factor receptor substrate 3 [Elysia marginata]
MGCTHSGLEGKGDVESFKVYNVNDHGVELHRGIIQIIDGDLVLYQKNKNPIRWPLRCLRRYGFDAELFSFESGRRCAMGSGIFAFKCTRAQDLFNLVQDSIQRAGELIQPAQHHVQNQSNPMGGSLRLNRRTEANGTTNMRNPQASNVMPPTTNWVPPIAVNGGYNSNSNLYVNSNIAQNAGHDYANTSFPNQNLEAFQIDRAAALVDFLHNPPNMSNGRSQVNYAELCMPDSQGSSDPNSPESELDQHRLSQPVHAVENNYLSDVVAGAFHEDAGYAYSAESEICPPDTYVEDAASTNYVNISVDDNSAAYAAAAGPMPQQLPTQPSSSAAQPPPPPPPTNGNGWPATHGALTNYANLALPPQKTSKQVNYILIDHEIQNSESVFGGAGNSPISPTGVTAFPESPSRKTQSYATIDFDRTKALSNATKPVEDEGGRKTRHNSTIEGIP